MILTRKCSLQPGQYLFQKLRIVISSALLQSAGVSCRMIKFSSMMQFHPLCTLFLGAAPRWLQSRTFGKRESCPASRKVPQRFACPAFRLRRCILESLESKFSPSLSFANRGERRRPLCNSTSPCRQSPAPSRRFFLRQKSKRGIACSSSQAPFAPASAALPKPIPKDSETAPR